MSYFTSQISTAYITTIKFTTSGQFVNLVDPSISNVILVVNYSVLCELIGIFGMMSNVMVLAVLTRMQSWRGTMNVALYGLTMADLLSLVFVTWKGVCYNPLFQNAYLPFIPDQVMYLTGGWPKICCNRITSWITAFIAFERCLCITHPLRVARILTPRVTLLVVVAIYVVMAASVGPAYHSAYFAWLYSSQRNATVVGLAFREDRDAYDGPFMMLGAILTLSAFVLVLACSLVLAWSLKQRQKWRQGFLPSNTKSLSDNFEHPDRFEAGTTPRYGARENRTGRMVVVISVIFVACYLPSSVNQLAMSLVKEYSKAGLYNNILMVSGSFCELAESINSFVNLFVYYNMSSKFRRSFEELFALTLTVEQ